MLQRLLGTTENHTGGKKDCPRSFNVEFCISAGSPVDVFREIAPRYPHVKRDKKRGNRQLSERLAIINSYDSAWQRARMPGGI